MGLLSRIKGWFAPPRAQGSTVNGDYWPSGGYGGLYGSLPAAGLRVGEREAMACSTAFACTRAISETLASISGIVYQQISEGVRQRAPSHRRGRCSTMSRARSWMRCSSTSWLDSCH